MEYQYEAIDVNGDAVKGQLEAESKVDVVRRLSRDGHTVVEVSERRRSALPTFQRRLRMADLLGALHELATLIESGVSLSDAVVAQSRGTYHPALGKAFEVVAKELTRGQSILQALRAADLPLPAYVYQLVEAGELSGRLPQSLRAAVSQMEYDLRVSKDLRGALLYPAILTTSGVVAVAVVFAFAVPQFANLLEEAEDLPFLAHAVLATGVWFNANTLLLTLLAVGAVLALLAAWRQPAIRGKGLDALAALPLLGVWLSESDTAKWASVMGAMLAARVELMDALALASQGVRISRRRLMLERAVADVKSGSALSAALEKQSALTPTGYNLIRVGEQSGQLPEMMRALATLYDDNADRRMKRVLTLIEPLAILLIGGAIGTIMAGLILAITSANSGFSI